MSFISIFVSGLLILTPALADNNFKLECNMQDEQAKVLVDLANHVSLIEKDMAKKKRKALGPIKCHEIVSNVDSSYQQLGLLVYKSYRSYLNNFLEEVTKDTKEVKNFKKLTQYFREGEGLKLMQAHAKAYKKNSINVIDNEIELKEQLVSSYKTLRESIGNKQKKSKQDFLPTTGHNCSPYQVKENPQKAMDQLISLEPHLTLYKNVCSTRLHDFYPHPKEQKIITFQLVDGRAMVWFCKQNFKSKHVEPFKGNYGLDRAILVKSKAHCLSHDLLNDKSFLGDQKQMHLSNKPDPNLEVNDTRLILANSLGKKPLTYTEFLDKNPTLLPESAKSFFPKVVPKECHSWSDYEKAIARSEKVVENMEMIFYSINDLEY